MPEASLSGLATSFYLSHVFSYNLGNLVSLSLENLRIGPCNESLNIGLHMCLAVGSGFTFVLILFPPLQKPPYPMHFGSPDYTSLRAFVFYGCSRVLLDGDILHHLRSHLVISGPRGSPSGFS